MSNTPTTETARSKQLWEAARQKGFNPNSAEYQAWLMERNQYGKALIGDNRSLNPNKVLAGLGRPDAQGGGVWGQSIKSGVNSNTTNPPATKLPAPGSPQTSNQNPSFDFSRLFEQINSQSAARAEADRRAQEQRDLAMRDWMNQQAELQRNQQAAQQAQIDEYNRKIAEQNQQVYERQLLLNDQQIKSINEQKAGIEKALRDASALFQARSGDVQARTGANVAQIIRNSAAERASGLANLSARNRGIDPSASGRFLNDLAAGKASALAETQSSGLESLRSIKDALDAQQLGGAAQLADLNRLATYLGTNVGNYFPGVSF